MILMESGGNLDGHRQAGLYSASGLINHTKE